MLLRPLRLASGLSFGAALALAAGRAGAQVAPVNPFSFGVSAGAAVPTGDGADGVKTGYSVDGIIAARVPGSALSFRGEVGYTRFGIKNAGDSYIRSISGVGNLVYAFSAGPTAVVRPYVIGGAGVYGIRGTVKVGNTSINGDTETKFGLNGGVGLEIPLSGITGFGEVRYTSVFTEDANTNWVPIRFGIRF